MPSVASSFKCLWGSGIVAGASCPSRLPLESTARKSPTSFPMLTLHESKSES